MSDIPSCPPPAARPRLLLVSPASAAANNGNWRTADRWASWLQPMAEVHMMTPADPPAAIAQADLMIALHARRSAQAIAAFAQTGRPSIVVLTGTDLYRDIRDDAAAKASLDHATTLVVLQDKGLDELSPAHRAKTVVIEQSAPAMLPLAPRRGYLDLVLVGHLRPEKDPLTALRALALTNEPALRLRVIGRLDDPLLTPAVTRAAAGDSRIELLGARSHPVTRGYIRRARALLLPSLMEGGANVLIEAVASQVPVLASRIPGSIGLLGEQYEGYFPVGDERALARLIGRLVDEAGFRDRLREQAAMRAPLFDPARESRLLVELVRRLLAGG